VRAVDEDARVFVISVAAELAGMHPQTLRQYDRLGLVSPGRTRGRGLRGVQRLSQDGGVNLAGIKRILELEEELAVARRQVEFLRDMLDPGRRVFTADPTGTVVADRRRPDAARATTIRMRRLLPGPSSRQG